MHTHWEKERERERAWVRHLLTRSQFPFGRFVDILRENGESGDIKECPLCQVLIMREAGCAQMMCGHCKHIFCWHCLKSLDVSQASVFNYNKLYYKFFSERKIWYYPQSHWLRRVYWPEDRNTFLTFWVCASFYKVFYKRKRQLWLCWIYLIFILWGWENSHKFYKPLIPSQVCITVSHPSTSPFVPPMCKSSLKLMKIYVIAAHFNDRFESKTCFGTIWPKRKIKMLIKCNHRLQTFICFTQQTDIMLRHYDKGPCRNKLGHSRASLFLHRTQVSLPRLFLFCLRIS